MLRSDDKLQLEIHGMLTPDTTASLMLLYAPLLGKDALVLYESMIALASLSQKIKNHLLLSKLSGISMERFVQLREVLEQFLLVKTYFDGIKNAYIYVLYMPKCGDAFLRHDVFGRLYLKKMGKQVYEFSRKSFALCDFDKTSYQDISVTTHALMQDWSDHQEEHFQNLKPTQPEVKNYAFNFDTFLNGLSTMILPQGERTKENLDFIAEKAGLYGIGEKDMQVFVGKSLNVKTNVLDKNKLIRFMQANKKSYDFDNKDPYRLPPVRFLQMKQQGVAVSNADQRLIDAVLSEKYHLVPEVINVLLEYVLERCNQVLSKSYVEKVAATWVRLHVDTAQKALEVISLEGKENKTYKAPVEKQLPKWYHDQDSVKNASEEVDAEALMEELRKLGES